MYIGELFKIPLNVTIPNSRAIHACYNGHNEKLTPQSRQKMSFYAKSPGQHL